MGRAERAWVQLLAALVIGAATSAQADHFDGDAGAGDPSWFAPSNWSADIVPTNGMTVQAIRPHGLPYGVVVDAPGAEAGSVDVGVWGHPGELTVDEAGTLNVAGSMTLAINSGLTGTVVNAGQMDVGGTLMLNSGGTGILTMSNGVLNVGSLDLNQTNGTGRLNMYGGTIRAPSLEVDGNAANTIDITGGMLVTDGDRSVGLNWMADIGRITAYGGVGVVYAWYDSGANETTLFALPDRGAVGHFTDPGTGAQFHPVGFNYSDLRQLTNGVLWHDNFNPGRYDEVLVSSNLADIAASGFNTVRVFIDNTAGPGVVLSSSSTNLSPVYMQNVASFLELADEMAVYWVDQLAEVVHEEAPGSRVDVNVFTYAAVERSIGDFSLHGVGWKDRYPFRPQALAASNADILDIHVYTADNTALQIDLLSIECGRAAHA